MKIEFHDLNSQYAAYKDEINSAIQAVLSSGQFIMGPDVAKFECALANYIGCKHVISCASGTDAIFLALLALDLSPGDEVITTPFSFIAAAEVIALLGVKLVFADIDEATYNLDPAKLEAKITKKTRAIIPVSLYGQPADMKQINALAENYSQKFNHRIYVIEDAAQSLGATFQDKQSGNLSDMGCLSFFPTKPLGCYGDGGAVTTSDDILAEKIKQLRVHGQVKRYTHKYIGFNCRLDTLQAAILRVKLKYFPEEVKKRHEIAQFYLDALASQEVILPIVAKEATCVYAQFSIRIKDRAKVMSHFAAHNIPIAVHYPTPLHLQECFKPFGYAEGDFPIAEKCAKEIMSLPMSAFVTREQQEYVVAKLTEVLESTVSSALNA